jgi:hypothetical protein
MNKSDLVEALSEREDLTKMKAEEVVDLVFSEMTNALVASDRVRGLHTHLLHRICGLDPARGSQTAAQGRRVHGRSIEQILNQPMNLDSGEMVLCLQGSISVDLSEDYKREDKFEYS